ncbi:class II glutamine amidotransferase [Leptothrix ochracea]|uniref:class II glutamine amidotransferase n=1 Tax=Leptothrix ochracea TaxID=735331 RepID=UPI0034E1ACEA
MCQLLGLNANTPTDLVFSFTGFAQRAVEHKDGFGIGFFEGPGVRLFVDDQSAHLSPVAQMLRTYPIKSRHIIAHIRKATQGRVALENTHPFQREMWGRYWVFAHNGNLTHFQPKLHAAFHPVGGTDSERAFCWLMQELAKNHASLPTVEALTETLAELVPRITPHGTFNFLLSNGEALWAHCSTKLHYVLRRHPFTAAELRDDDVQIDFARHTTPQDRVAVIVTEPLTRNEAWQALQPGELAVFKEGERLMRGRLPVVT